MSYRQFSLEYVNQLFNKLAIKKPQNSFSSKEKFLKYAAIVLSNEKVIEAEANLESIALPLFLGEEGSLWNKISKSLLDIYGEARHRSWFSRIKSYLDERTKALTLITKGEFSLSYIQDNYKIVIENCLHIHAPGYNLKFEAEK